VDSFVLPGNVTAYTDSPIYARTSGYLTKWYFDIGARVKKGALLAEIATPELDQQLTQAEATWSPRNPRQQRQDAGRPLLRLVKSDAVSRRTRTPLSPGRGHHFVGGEIRAGQRAAAQGAAVV
jgi:multidrug efflux pump subunit AcrA (membrane-fusion protein)